MTREIRDECIYFIRCANFIQVTIACILFDQIKSLFLLMIDYVFYLSLCVLYRRSFVESHYHNTLHLRKDENLQFFDLIVNLTSSMSIDISSSSSDSHHSYASFNDVAATRLIEETEAITSSQRFSSSSLRRFLSRVERLESLLSSFLMKSFSFSSLQIDIQNYDMKSLKKQNVFEILLIKQHDNTKNENIDENRQTSKITTTDDEN